MIGRFLAILFLLISGYSLFGQVLTDSTEVIEQSLIRYIPFRSDTGTYFRSINYTDTVPPIIVDDFYPSAFNQGYYARKNGKYGVIGTYGDTIIPFEKDTIYYFEGMTVTQVENSYEVIVPYQKEPQSFQADSIYLHDGLIYHYSGGKVGVANYQFVIPALYEGITQLTCYNSHFKVTTESQKTFFKVITINGSLQLINTANKKLLPTGVSEIQCYIHGYLRFYDDHEKFYNVYTDEIIDNQGNDVIIYANNTYKCYDKNRQKSRFISGGKVFYGQYDDYFLMDNPAQLAVRENGRIGVIHTDTRNPILPLRYEQVKNFRPVRNPHFKTYQNNYCGLTQKGGKTTIPHEYTDLKSTYNRNLYIALKYNKGGVVDINGESIIPLEYDQIIVNSKAIIVRKGGRFGMFDHKGREIVPVEYKSVSRNFTEGDNYYVFYNERNRLFIANHTGLIGEQPVEHIEFGDDLIKTYKGNKIYVSILDENGKIEESQEYENLQSFKIQGRDYFTPWSNWSWTTDVFEENQLTGLFGRRFLTDTGMSRPPIYNTLRYSRYNEPFGKRIRNRQTVWVLPGLDVMNQRYYEDVSSKKEYKPYLMIDISYQPPNIYETGSEKYMMQDTLGKLYVPRGMEDVDKKKYPANKFAFADYLPDGIKKHYVVDGLKITKGKGDISLKTYYDWMNVLGTYEPDIDDLKIVFDPYNKVKFINKKIMLSTHHNVRDDNLNLWFNPPQYFDECKKLNMYDALYMKRGNTGTIQLIHKTPVKLNNEGEPSISNIIDYKEFYIQGFDRLRVRSNKKEQYKIHLDFPDFLYKSDDYFTAYNDGFLTLKITDSNYVLMQPDQTIIAECLESVEHVENNHFLVKGIGEEGTHLVNMKTMDTLFNNVERISSFNKDLRLVEQMNEEKQQFVLIDNEMNEVYRSRINPRPLKNSFIWTDYDKKIVLNLMIRSIDTLTYDTYELFNNGFLHYTYNNRNYVRLFGSPDSIKVRNDISFEAFSDRLIGEYNNRFIYVTESLQKEKFNRKTELNILSDLFMVVNDGEQITVLDESNSTVYESNNIDVEFNVSPEYISFYTGDTLLYILSNGSVTGDYNKTLTKTFASSEYEITKNNKGYGLMVNGKSIVKNKYESLKVLNSGEIEVEQRGHQRMYDSWLKSLDVNGREIYPLDIPDWYLIKNGPLGYVMYNDRIYLEGMEFWENGWLVPQSR